MEYNVLKGTHDIILNDAENFSKIENLLINIALTYNFKEFRTPIIEKSELFTRSSGESSDIVRKEMYTFLDKGKREISLRPEFTAGIVRSVVNNKLLINDKPIKAFYLGPVFRYDRPQLGRYRQFNQFGIEIIGSNSYLRDVECIMFGYNCLKMLGLKNIKLIINSLGDETSRVNYRKALTSYFKKHIRYMCDDCKERLKLNPLRILDCKVKNDQKYIKNSPNISEFLSENSKTRFQNVLNELDKLGVEYYVDEQLVRGLDYYSETVFEFHYTTSNNIDYGAIGAGGFYNNLVKELGGQEVSGIGLSFGIERLFNILNDENLLNKPNSLDLYLIPVADSNKEYTFSILSYLRNNGYSCEINLETSSFSSSFKKAEKTNAKYAIIIGDNEEKSGILTIKNINTKEQYNIKEENLIEFLDETFEIDEQNDEHCNLDEEN